ncbi:MAG TPA: DNA methyltransferase [Candidatus Xenobia bacterium]|jgi:DNA modification methylase
MLSRQNTLNDLTGRDWIRFTKSWVKCDGRPGDITADIEKHPASFPPDLAEDFIRFFTKQGQTVLDPFLGCGSTLEACARSGRQCVGVELNPYWVDASRRRAALLQHETRIIQGSATDLAHHDIGLVDYCITSPPYFDMLRHSRGGVVSNHKKRARKGLDVVYSESPDDLGNLATYQDYLDALARIFQYVHGLLRPGGYLTVIVQNVRVPDGTLLPLAWDLARALSPPYRLQQERIWVQDQKMLGIWGYPTTYVSNVHHHYCLMFQKAASRPRKPQV